MKREQKIYLARRYAQACVNVFGRDMQVADIASFHAVAQFLGTHRRILFFLHVPFINDAIKLQALEMVRAEYTLPVWCTRLFTVLIEHKRAFLVAHVLAYVASFFAKKENVGRFTVTSAHPLHEEQRARCVELLTRLSNKTIVCTYAADQTLIAGVRMQSDTALWEYSVNQQFRTLQHSFCPLGEYHGD